MNGLETWESRERKVWQQRKKGWCHAYSRKFVPPKDGPSETKQLSARPRYSIYSIQGEKGMGDNPNVHLKANNLLLMGVLVWNRFATLIVWLQWQVQSEGDINLAKVLYGLQLITPQLQCSKEDLPNLCAWIRTLPHMSGCLHILVTPRAPWEVPF